MTGPQEGSQPRRPPVRIKARDTFYGDLPASLHGIEKTNVDDAFQLDRAAALYETLYPVASRVRPMAERLMTRQAKESWRRIRQAVFDRMSVAFVVSDREESDPAWPVAAEGMWNDSGFVIQRNATAMPRALRRPARDGPARSSRRRALVARGDRPSFERDDERRSPGWDGTRPAPAVHGRRLDRHRPRPPGLARDDRGPGTAGRGRFVDAWLDGDRRRPPGADPPRQLRAGA